MRVDRPGEGGKLQEAGSTMQSPKCYFCETRENRSKLTCEGTHVTTYRPINTGVGRRPWGREAPQWEQAESKAPLAGLWL